MRELRANSFNLDAHDGEDQRRKSVVFEYDGRRPGSMVVRPSPDVRTAILAKQVNRAASKAPKGPTSQGAVRNRSCQSAGAEQLAVPAERHGTSEDGTISVKAPPAVIGAGGRYPRHPRALASARNRETPRALTSATAAAMWRVDAPKTSRPKLARANSNANPPSSCQRELRGAQEIALTLRRCAAVVEVDTTTLP